MCSTKGSLSLIVLLASSSSMFAAQPPQNRAAKHRQAQIDRAAAQALKKASPGQRVLADPNVSFNTRLATTNHNVRASSQTMQNLKRK